MKVTCPSHGIDSIMVFDLDLDNKIELGFIEEIWTYYRRQKRIHSFRSSSLFSNSKDSKISNFVILLYQGQKVSYIKKFFAKISSLNSEAVKILACRESMSANLPDVKLGADHLILINEKTEREKPVHVLFRQLIGTAGEQQAQFADQIAFDEFSKAMGKHQAPTVGTSTDWLAQVGFRFPVVTECLTLSQFARIRLHFAGIRLAPDELILSLCPHLLECDMCAHKVANESSVFSAHLDSFINEQVVYDDNDLGKAKNGLRVYEGMSARRIIGARVPSSY